MKNTLRKKLFLALAGSLMSSFAGAQIKVEAETFSNPKHGDSEIILENDKTSVGYFDEAGEELNYKVNIPSAGLYQISFKYLTGKDGSLRIETNDGSFSLFNTKANNTSGGWWELPMNQWPSTPYEGSALFYFEAGEQSFKVVNMGYGINLDYFEFKQSSSNDGKVASIKTNPEKLILMPRESGTVIAMPYNSNGELLASNISWSSNAPNGNYTAGNSYGKDIITITAGGVEKKMRVRVEFPQKKQEFVVSKYGQLKVSNGAVCDQNGNKVSLMGPSFFWSCSAPLWWKKETVDYLVSKYNVQIIRLPVSIAPGEKAPWEGGWSTWNTDNYYHNPEYTRKMVDEMVKAAIENDIYVIIDFHEHYAQAWTDLSKDFFKYFSEKWGECPNVMYEIFNEPTTDNGTVVNYAKEIIPEIRKYDNDNIIIVGSTQWSREPHNVTSAGNGQSNIAYTWHGYVEYGHQGDWNGHSDWNRGVPVVVTEWGLNWSKNDGGLLNIYRDRSLINCFWSMSNKGGDDAKWSVLKDNVYKTTDWNDSDMTENGAYLLGVAKNWINFTPNILPVVEDDDDPSVVDDVVAENLNVLVYPNPTSNGICTVLVNEDCNVVVSDMSGRIVLSTVAYPGADNKISLPNKGFYLLRAGNEVKKIIVK